MQRVMVNFNGASIEELKYMKKYADRLGLSLSDAVRILAIKGLSAWEDEQWLSIDEIESQKQDVTEIRAQEFIA